MTIETFRDFRTLLALALVPATLLGCDATNSRRLGSDAGVFGEGGNEGTGGSESTAGADVGANTGGAGPASSGGASSESSAVDSAAIPVCTARLLISAPAERPLAPRLAEAMA